MKYPVIQLKHRNDTFGHFAYYEILQTYYKDLNLPDNRCESPQEQGDTSVRRCIEKYIEKFLKCHIPWHVNASSTKKCRTEDEFLSYGSLSNKLAFSDEEEISHITGCTRSCQHMEYSLEYTSPVGKKYDSSPDLLKTRFVYLSGEKQQFCLIFVREMSSLYDKNI